MTCGHPIGVYIAWVLEGREGGEKEGGRENDSV